MKIDTRNMTAPEIQKLTGCSRTSAWRARKRGWVIGPSYHKKKKGDGVELPIDVLPKLYGYMLKCLPDAPHFDIDDLVMTTVFVALNGERTNTGTVEQYIFGIARTQVRNYRNQGIRSFVNAVHNWAEK